jgi:hypothetical protein
MGGTPPPTTAARLCCESLQSPGSPSKEMPGQDRQGTGAIRDQGIIDSRRLVGLWQISYASGDFVDRRGFLLVSVQTTQFFWANYASVCTPQLLETVTVNGFFRTYAKKVVLGWG